MHPDSKFKIAWDLIIILFSVYNSILIPYEFAYSFDTNIIFQVFDRMVDVSFGIDILINFRTIYRDSKTDEEVYNGRKVGKGILWFRLHLGISLMAGSLWTWLHLFHSKLFHSYQSSKIIIWGFLACSSWLGCLGWVEWSLFWKQIRSLSLVSNLHNCYSLYWCLCIGLTEHGIWQHLENRIGTHLKI